MVMPMPNGISITPPVLLPPPRGPRGYLLVRFPGYPAGNGAGQGRLSLVPLKRTLIFRLCRLASSLFAALMHVYLTGCSFSASLE